MAHSRGLLSCLTAVALAVAPLATGSQEIPSKTEVPRFITIASGPTSGLYYPIARALSVIVKNDLGYRSSVQSTGGSVENLDLIGEGRAELAIVMADTALQARRAFGAFEGRPARESLRGLMSLYPNYVQLVALESSGVRSFRDLRGRRIGVGAQGSGVEANARLVLEAYGLDYSSLRPEYLNYGEAIDQMRNGLVDAAFVTSGIPNATVAELAKTKRVRLVPIEGEAKAYLLRKYSFFGEDRIPALTYGNAEPVETLTIMNILVVDESLPEEVAYDLAKGIFANIDRVKGSHGAARRHLGLESALGGMVLPLHPGAARFYREAGLLH